MEAFQRHRTSSFLPSWCQTERKEARRGARRSDMVSTISFIQANLQHSIAVPWFPLGH